MSRVATVVLTTLLVSAGPAAGIDSFFDIFTTDPTIGIAPLDAHEQGIGRMTGGSFQFDLLGRTTLRQMAVAIYGTAGDPLMARAVSSNGLPPGNPAIDSFFDVFFEATPGGGQGWPDDSFFDIFYEFDYHGQPARLVPIHPGDIYFDVIPGDSFFDVIYRVEVGPGGGCHEMRTHFECQPGLKPGWVWIVPSPTYDSFFDVFFELHVYNAQLDPTVPVFHAVTNGEYFSAPLSVEQVSWGEVKSLYRQ